MQEITLEQVLLFRAGSCGCAIPVSHVVETMRPLPIEPLAGLPAFVMGVAVIRGVATPVVDLGSLLSALDRAPVARFITLKTGGRQVALGVESVAGVARLDDSKLEALPPLLKNPEAGAVGLIGALDGRLLLVLRAGRVVPEEAWSRLAGAERAS